MDVEKKEMVIVLDYGKELEEVASEMACCKGRPAAAASGDPV
jgi:hypothetical protein